MDISNNDAKVTLTPEDVAKLLGFEVDREIASKSDDRSSLVEAENDPNFEELETERGKVFRDITYLYATIEKLTEAKKDVLELLDNVTDLEGHSESLREEYTRNLIQLDGKIYEKLGISSERLGSTGSEGKRVYPVPNALLAGFFMWLIGLIFLIPLQLTPSIRLVVGLGALLAGIVVMLVGLLSMRYSKPGGS